MLRAGSGREAVVPNPKAKLLDQMREIMRLRHYSIRTEQSYCDWIRRYILFHKMRSRDELSPGTGKVEQFLSELAVKGECLFARCPGSQVPEGSARVGLAICVPCPGLVH